MAPSNHHSYDDRMSDSFCVLPWMHLFVDGHGYYYNCCFGIATDAYSKDKSGSIIKASEPNSILNHWNSQAMQELRQSFNRNEKSGACARCWQIEETGTESFRMIANSEYPIPEKERTVQAEPIFRYVDLRFGNLCNLACRMCIPYNTRKLFDEYTELYNADAVAPYRNMNWFESPHFWEELHQYRHHFRKIHLAGGEPLLIKDCWNFLRKLSEDDCAKNITLSYNTNLSKIPPEAKEIWPRFKNVVLIVSMDAVGPANEFIRYPQSWADFDRNLRTIENEYDAYNIRTCQVQVTVQAYNLKRIEEICEYMAGFRRVLSYPLFNFLFEPEYLSPHVLPEAYREEAIAEIETYTAKVQNGWNNLHPMKRDPLVAGLKGMVSYLRGPEKSHLFRQFQRHNDIFDRHRGQRILDFLPELAPVYK